jgi:hypothetical protein
VKPDLNDLAALLDEEVAIGEELRRNLAMQRQALIAWDMEVLIAAIEAREARLRSLAELERRRVAVLQQGRATEASLQLKHFIAEIPDGVPVRRRLQTARARALEIFTRLEADERNINGLMENLLEHLREALTPLARPVISLYGERGAAAPQRPASAFIQNKA